MAKGMVIEAARNAADNARTVRAAIRGCGALIGPEGERCAVPSPCPEHGPAQTPGERIAELERHRRQWRGVASVALDLLERLGAMDLHDANGHTGVYACSWCDAESQDVAAVPHLEGCQLAAVVRQYLDLSAQSESVDR